MAPLTLESQGERKERNKKMKEKTSDRRKACRPPDWGEHTSQNKQQLWECSPPTSPARYLARFKKWCGCRISLNRLFLWPQESSPETIHPSQKNTNEAKKSSGLIKSRLECISCQMGLVFCPQQSAFNFTQSLVFPQNHTFILVF